jgi:hypothetical protein
MDKIKWKRLQAQYIFSLEVLFILRIQIQRLLCFMLLLNGLFGGFVFIEKASAAESAETVLIDRDFSKVAEGTSASKLDFTPMPLPQGSGTAVVEVEPLTNQKALHLHVEDAGTSAFKIGKTFTDKLVGYVTSEITFMQPSAGNVAKKDNSLLYLTDSSAVNTSVDVGLSTTRGVTVFVNAAPVDLATGYELDKWYTLKVVHYTYTKKANIYLNGTLIVSRRDVNGAFDVQRIMLGTPKGNGDLYVGSLKVTYKPGSDAPNLDAPDIKYTISKNNEIAIDWVPDAAAWRYRLYTKRNINDTPYLAQSYNGNPGKIPFDENSVKNEWDWTLNKAVPITNGQKYYVGVAAYFKNMKTNVEVVSPNIAWVEATPLSIIPIASESSNVITNLNVDETYYAKAWSVQSGIHVGDMPLAEKTYKITELPSQYESMDWVRPSGKSQNQSPSNSSNRLASFNVRDHASVYVAMDERAAAPTWLTAASGWTATNDKIKLSDGLVGYSLKIYKKDFFANSLVTMGLNPVLADVTSGKNIGYFVLAQRTSVGLKADPIPSWANKSEYSVTGSVYENVYTSSVTLSVYQNKSLVFNSKLNENNFKVDLSLTPGSNLIEVFAARGTSTLSDKVSATINYDTVSPELHISVPPTTVNNAVYTLQGFLGKSANLSVKLNGALIADSVAKAAFEPFSYPLTLSEGSNVIEVSSVDAAGNVSSANYSINYVFWAGQAATYDLNGNQLNAITASKDIVAQRQVTNTTSTAKQMMLVFVLYDQNHSMVDFSGVMADFEPGEAKTLSTGFTLPAQVSGYYVKAFIWDNLGGMSPLSYQFLLP